MAEKLSITCDNCKTELVVDSPYPHNYGLHLSAKDYGINTSGMTYALSMRPEINPSKNFCNLKCLAEWVKWITKAS